QQLRDGCPHVLLGLHLRFLSYGAHIVHSGIHKLWTMKQRSFLSLDLGGLGADNKRCGVEKSRKRDHSRLWIVDKK
ncbi:MAG: hypothetical protein ACO37X_04415, partial [Ilumatobacteraceae bacterium]